VNRQAACCGIQTAWVSVAAVAVLVCASSTLAAEPLRKLRVNASQVQGQIRSLQGVDGVPVGAVGAGNLGILDGPNLLPHWRAARVDLVRSYIWQSRLDTIDNPGSLFPRWSANADDPASYNFAATDKLVRASREIGADILFTIASSIPHNKLPPADVAKYAEVARHIVMHYNQGWAGGMTGAVRYWEIGDEPDLNKYHFAGTPEQFYAMYEAVARAIKSVDASLQVGGPGLAFPINVASPFREGFMQVVAQRSLPCDFFSFKWYSDQSADPLDLSRVSAVITGVLAANGLAGKTQFVTDWNYAGIPTNRPDRLRMGVYEAATLIYMQDTPIKRAIIFRGDAAMYTPEDPDADITTRMFNADGTPMKNAFGFASVGRMLETPQRLKVSGGDDKGFAVLAGRNATGTEVRVLIANYAIPATNLTPQLKDTIDFNLPVAGKPVPVSWKQLPRRVDAVQKNNGGYDLSVTGLSWGRVPYTVERYRLDAGHDLTLVDTTTGKGSRVRLSASLPEPSIELIVIRIAP
jgi:hypothetical protein